MTPQTLILAWGRRLGQRKAKKPQIFITEVEGGSLHVTVAGDGE
jgi:hypothetical protein